MTNQYGFPGLDAYMPQMPYTSGSPYDLAAAMAYSNLMAGQGQAQGALQAQMRALGGVQSLAAPDVGAWMGPHGMAGLSDYGRQVVSDAGGGGSLGGYRGALGQDLQAQSQASQFGNYQAFTSQEQQLALAHAQQLQQLALQAEQTLQQEAMAGTPGSVAQAGLQALIAASGEPGLMQRLGPAMQAFYPSAGGVSPIFADQQSQALQSSLIPLVLKAYGTPGANAGNSAIGASSEADVERYAISQALADPNLAKLVAQDPAMLHQAIQAIYGQTNARFGPGGTQALSGDVAGGGGSAVAANGGPVDSTDRIVNAGRGAAEWGTAGALIGSVLPGPGTVVGGALGAGLGGLWNLFHTGQHTPNMSLAGALGEIAGGGVKGLEMGALGRLGLGGLPALAETPVLSRLPFVGRGLGSLAERFGQGNNFLGTGLLGRFGIGPSFGAAPGIEQGLAGAGLGSLGYGGPTSGPVVGPQFPGGIPQGPIGWSGQGMPTIGLGSLSSVPNPYQYWRGAPFPWESWAG